MGKKHDKSKKDNVQANSINTFLPECLDKNEWQHIIANALIESEEIRKQREEKRKEEELKIWHENIGYKDYSNSKFKCKWLLQFLNDIWILYRFLFMPQRKIHGDRAISTLLKMILSLFFAVGSWIVFLLGLILFASIPLQFFIPSLRVPWYINLLLALFSFLILIISGLLKISSIEVEKMEDRNYLVGIFASVTSIISITIAIIAVVRGG